MRGAHGPRATSGAYKRPSGNRAWELRHHHEAPADTRICKADTQEGRVVLMPLRLAQSRWQGLVNFVDTTNMFSRARRKQSNEFSRRPLLGPPFTMTARLRVLE